jgi:hypothetical protein
LKIDTNWENPDFVFRDEFVYRVRQNSYFDLKEKKVDFSICNAQQLIPHNPEQYGLNVIQELKTDMSVGGFSDHPHGNMHRSNGFRAKFEFHVVLTDNFLVQMPKHH